MPGTGTTEDGNDFASKSPPKKRSTRRTNFNHCYYLVIYDTSYHFDLKYFQILDDCFSNQNRLFHHSGDLFHLFCEFSSFQRLFSSPSPSYHHADSLHGHRLPHYKFGLSPFSFPVFFAIRSRQRAWFASMDVDCTRTWRLCSSSRRQISTLSLG